MLRWGLCFGRKGLQQVSNKASGDVLLCRSKEPSFREMIPEHRLVPSKPGASFCTFFTCAHTWQAAKGPVTRGPNRVPRAENPRVACAGLTCRNRLPVDVVFWLPPLWFFHGGRRSIRRPPGDSLQTTNNKGIGGCNPCHGHGQYSEARQAGHGLGSFL
jgi:hypothetical protein